MKQDTVPEAMLDVANTQEDHLDELLSKANVNGVAIGHKITDGEDTGEPAVTVLVETKIDDIEDIPPDDRVPEEVDGVPTDVQDVGVILVGGGPQVSDEVALTEDEDAGVQSLRRRVRPVEGGYSVGHYRITAGTYGTACYDLSPFPSIPQRYYILSNNHVLANSNNARVGDPILQPGPFDGGRYPQDVVARLTRWVPIKFDGSCNYVDAAIAQGQFHDLDREIYWIGYVRDLYTAPKVGDIVQKTGRTTNFTTGRVTNINATVNVGGYPGGTARFCRQIITTAMSAGGDSGSLVTNGEEGGVGLLFAGSSQITILNNLLYVQAYLRVRIHEH